MPELPNMAEDLHKRLVVESYGTLSSLVSHLILILTIIIRDPPIHILIKSFADV